jgi:hypothetical protein
LGLELPDSAWRADYEYATDGAGRTSVFGKGVDVVEGVSEG